MNDIALEDNATMTEPIEEKDAAWASINTPLHMDTLQVFIQDVERLLRINPMLEFKKFEKLGPSHYFMQGKNISQDPAYTFETELQVTQTANGIEIEYEQGIKARTVVQIEAATLEDGEPGSKLTLTDHYNRLDEEALQERLNEVDKSLVNWATDLQRYTMNWRRWSRFKLWRWYMRRIWQPMKPTARRITYMLLWISIVEVALIALGAAIYLSEYR